MNLCRQALETFISPTVVHTSKFKLLKNYFYFLHKLSCLCSILKYFTMCTISSRQTLKKTILCTQLIDDIIFQSLSFLPSFCKVCWSEIITYILDTKYLQFSFDEMEIQKVNFTDLECYDDCENGGGSKIWTKIIGLALYLFGCLGLFLFYGIIHYEKFGQDSQKRSFPGIQPHSITVLEQQLKLALYFDQLIE